MTDAAGGETFTVTVGGLSVGGRARVSGLGVAAGVGPAWREGCVTDQSCGCCYCSRSEKGGGVTRPNNARTEQAFFCNAQ